MVPDALCKEYLRCWIHRPAKNNCAFIMLKCGLLLINRQRGAMGNGQAGSLMIWAFYLKKN